MPGIFAAHDIFLFPSIWEEPLARVVQEAMACGLVVIGTDTGGTPELLAHGHNGLVFSAGDAPDLARSLETAIADQHRFASLSQNARRTVETHFTMERMIDYNLCMCMCYGLPGFIQDAAVRALQDDINIAGQLRTALARRYQVLNSELADLKAVRLYGNPGGMFALLDIRALAIEGAAFARILLNDHNVSVLPCEGFGKSGRGLLRISLCENEDRLREACGRLGRMIASL
jgi:hypothetical protein